MIGVSNMNTETKDASVGWKSLGFKTTGLKLSYLSLFFPYNSFTNTKAVIYKILILTCIFSLSVHVSVAVWLPKLN